jgi:hypothetical protein
MRDRQQQRDDGDEPPEKSVSRVVTRIPKWFSSACEHRDQRDARDLVARSSHAGSMPTIGPTKLTNRLVRADVDRRGDEHEAGQVEPRGRPAPALAAEDRAPVVEAAGGRKRRRDLGHAQRDDQRERDADRPHDAGRRAAHRRHPSCSEVMPPASTQMVENEIAKFENAPMRRRSSCL